VTVTSKKLALSPASGLKMTLLAAVGALALAACSQQQTAEAPVENTTAAAAPVAAEGTSIERLDPALDAIIPPGAVLEKIGSGFGFAEGPVWYKGEIRFSDLTGNKLHAIGPDGQTRLLMDKSGGKDEIPAGSYQGSNGAVVDEDGSILMTRHGARDIVRVKEDGTVEPFLTKNGDGARFNSPNDLAFSPDGALWFTDPPYGLIGQDKDPAKEAKFNGVYRYKDGKVTAVITDVPRPNGIGFSPDGKKLYISNSEPEMFINVYDVNADGTVANGRRFTTFPGPNPTDVPDGLKVDSQGNVWASGPGGIRIISPDGKVLGQLKSPDIAQANVAWGGPDLKTAYIMAAGSVYRLNLAIPGAAPLYSK
jgi:gluconolactonase